MYYLVMCLAGLAVGLWPDIIWRWSVEFPNRPLLALRCLAVAQMGYVLLVYPMVLLKRGEKETGFAYFCSVFLEMLGFLVVTIPLYVAAGFISDAVWYDCLRTTIVIVSLFPLAWAAGYWLGRSPAEAGPVVVILLVVALGLPATYYVVREFLNIAAGGGAAQVLWRITPATFAWEVSAPRSHAGIIPWPLWPVYFWIGAAVLIRVLDVMSSSSRTKTLTR